MVLLSKATGGDPLGSSQVCFVFARVARLVKTAAVTSLIYGSSVTGTPPAQHYEARLIARKNCRGKAYHRCLDLDLVLEGAGIHPGRCGATSAAMCGSSAGSLRFG